MSDTSRRLAALFTATGLATASLLAVSGTPALADDSFAIEMSGFDEYPDAGGDPVSWPVTLVNGTDEDLAEPVFSFELFEEEDDRSALEIAVGDTGCDTEPTDTGTYVTCTLDTLPANSEIELGFTLSLRAEADRVHHGLSYVQAQLRQPGAEDNPTYAEKMVTLDASLPLDDEGRITNLEAPETVGTEQVYGDDDAKGQPLTFTVVNNDYDTGTLVHANLVISVDTKTGIMPATKLDGCNYSRKRTVLTCPMPGLGAKDERDYAFTLWARSASAGQHAKPGKVNIDIELPHGDHGDAWAHEDFGVELVAGDGSGQLPVTGSRLSTAIGWGAAAILLGGVLLLVARRRTAAAEVTHE